MGLIHFLEVIIVIIIITRMWRWEELTLKVVMSKKSILLIKSANSFLPSCRPVTGNYVTDFSQQAILKTLLKCLRYLIILEDM